MPAKIVLVTGSNRGIGLATVKGFLDLGFTTILTSRKPEDGAKVLEELGAPDSLHYHQLDVSSQESVNQLLDWVEATFGRLDILVNNAGINYDTWQKGITADLDTVKETLDVNLLGPWRMCKAFIPMMQRQGYGRIVNVSSGAGALDVIPTSPPAYGVSKAALNALTIKLAAELKGSGILINAICPGWVRTEMGGRAAPRSPEQGAETILWAAQLPEGGPSGLFFRDKLQISF